MHSKYLPKPVAFVWYPIVWHYNLGIGQAREYRGTIWHVKFNSGCYTWINKAALKVLAY